MRDAKNVMTAGASRRQRNHSNTSPRKMSKTALRGEDGEVKKTVIPLQGEKRSGKYARGKEGVLQVDRRRVSPAGFLPGGEAARSALNFFSVPGLICSRYQSACNSNRHGSLGPEHARV